MLQEQSIQAADLRPKDILRRVSRHGAPDWWLTVKKVERRGEAVRVTLDGAWPQMLAPDETVTIRRPA